MTRQRLYNPVQLTPEELRASFVARKDTLAEMLRLVREQTPGHPCQHMMLIGPRGMGKTTLGLRLLHEILETPDLAADWQPVAFHEESYGIGDLADFWLAALRHLTRATGDSQWGDRAKALPKDEKDTDRQAAYALASLMDFCQTSGKRLLLFVENLDTVIEQLSDERQIHALRMSLIERTDILLIGSANTVFEAIRSHGEPLYEFFRLFVLKGLGSEDIRRILVALADGEGKPEVMEALDREHGRLETIRRLTGGNPRLVVLACRILIESPLGSAFEDLERLIDEQTPYFKARIEELPVQARRVFHCLAEGWKPMQAREVADAAKLNSSHASAQLRQLIEKGYAREVTLPNAKRTLYEVGDRFYNIYYVLRFSHSGRDRLARLIAFLHDLFGRTGMRTLYPAVLDALRIRGSRPRETSDLLSILANYIAEDDGFEGREDWLQEALDLADEIIGPNAPVIREMLDVFATSERLYELIERGWELLDMRLFHEAEMQYREAIKEKPNDIALWNSLGWVLLLQKRHEDALDAFERVLDKTLQDDTPTQHRLTMGSLAGRAYSLLELKQYESVVCTAKKFQEHVDLHDVTMQRYTAALLYSFKANALSKLGRTEEAITVWEQAVQHVHMDDPPVIRYTAAKSLGSKGSALLKLNRTEEAIAAWELVARYIHKDDSADLRLTVAVPLRAKGEVLAQLDRTEEAIEAWEQVLDYVCLDDPASLRRHAVKAMFSKSATLMREQPCHDFNSVWLASDYVRPSDPADVLQQMTKVLTTAGHLLNLLEKYPDAEKAYKVVIHIEPTHYESWRFLAEAILCQGDVARLAEAEEYARRAVELTQENPGVFHTLSDVLACRGNWPEALGMLERAIRASGGDFPNQERPRLMDSFIKAIVAGHGHQVKRIMEEAGLVESMEPLWHAVRAELGEELEPLPAEIMDTVTDIRREVANSPKSPSGAT